MKQTVNSFFFTILVFFLLVPSQVKGSEDEANLPISVQPETIPFYTGTISISASLSISTSGKASCYSSIYLYSGYTANLTMHLQRKATNGTWITIESWYGSGSGITGVVLTESYWGLSAGNTYRVFASANVYKNSALIESVSVSSTERAY